MTDTIAMLRAERERLVNRMRMIDAALEKYDAWEREVNAMLTRQTPGSVVATTPEAAPGRYVATESAHETATPMAEFEDRVRTVLTEAGRPLTRGPLLQELQHLGVVIGGADERNTLSARLTRMPWVVNLRGHGYWLKEREYRPAGYKADDAVSPAVIEGREAEALDDALDLIE